MATELKSPGTMADSAVVGSVAWANPDNAKVSDNVYATALNTAGDQDTHYLKATNFGFSIPVGATINGIMAEVEGKVVRVTGTQGGLGIARIVKSNVIGSTPPSTQGGMLVAEGYRQEGSSTELWGETWTPADINNSTFGFAFAEDVQGTSTNIFDVYVDHIRITVTYTIELPTVTTQAASSVAATTTTGNGNITATGGANADTRGIVYSTTTHSDPGNVAPGSSSYSGLVNETGGSFGTGAFTESLTGLTSRTIYYARAYAHNSAGYSYGGEVNFTTIGFTNPGNIYATDDTYATLAANSGILSVEISKDGGSNYGSALTVTFTASDTLQTAGTGSTELWGASYTRADMVDSLLRIRLSQGSISQVYKTFGFTTGTETLTGIEVAIEGKYGSPTMSLDLLKVKIYYGTSILPVQAGSFAYASNGRKVGEGAGVGTGTTVYFDATAWRRTGDDTTVAA